MIACYIERGKLYTDELRYGEHIEIIFKDSVYQIKDLKKLRDEWARKNNTIRLEEKYLKEFTEMNK